MKLLTHIPSWLKNKYLLAGAFFLVWMSFFDPKDIASNVEHRAKFRELQSSKKHLTQLIAETEGELDQLKTNAQSIEKYARENYLMKKDNEDLFVVQETAAEGK